MDITFQRSTQLFNHLFNEELSLDACDADKVSVTDVELFIASAATFAESCASSSACGGGVGFEHALMSKYRNASVVRINRDVCVVFDDEIRMEVPSLKMIMRAFVRLVCALYQDECHCC